MRKNKRPRTLPVKPGKGKLLERAVGPAADNFGKEIAPLGTDAGKLLVSAVRKSVYGLDKVGNWLRDAINSRLKNVPKEKIVEPSPRIAVPAVQALVYSMNDDLIRELFANLLASDMNAERKSGAHPAFVEMVKEMRPEDARVFLKLMESPEYKYNVSLRGGGRLSLMDFEFSFEIPHIDKFMVAVCLDNLLRLGLIEFRKNQGPIGERFAEKQRAAVARHEEMARAFSEMPEGAQAMGLSGPVSVGLDLSGIYPTGFGVEFWKACMNEREGAVIPK